MSRKINSPNRTYVDMLFVRRKNARERQNNKNNSFQTQNTHNHRNASQRNAQLPNIPTYTTIDLDSPDPLRKLEPPDAPHPNQENNQYNCYNKTGQNEGKIIRITKNTAQTHPKNGQVHNSSDLSPPKPSTSKSDQVSKVSTNGTMILRKKPNPACENVLDSDSSSDSDDSSDSAFFSKKKSLADRLHYTGAEDLEILRFVLRDNNIYRTTSISLWKELESEKMNPRRTFHSLKNRFIRNIKPCIFQKYGRFLTAEKEKMLLKKFPELSERKKKVKTHSCIPIQGYRNKEPPQPCPAKEKLCPPHQTPALPEGGPKKKPGEARSFKDASVGTEEDRVQLVSPPTNKTDVNCGTKEPPVPGIELKKKGKLKGFACQTFEYSAALRPFEKEAAVNLNLLLTRDSLDSVKTSERTLLDETGKPVNVRVTVTVSTGAIKRNLKMCGRRRRRKKKSESGPEKFYVLGLRKGTRGKWKCKARLYEEIAKDLFSEIEKKRKAADEEERRGRSDSEDEVRPMVLRSQTRTVETEEDEVRPMVLRSQTRTVETEEDEVRPMVLRSQIQTIETEEDERGSMSGFESSSDDGSYFDEAKKKVESMYQVVVLSNSDMEGSQESQVWKERGQNKKTSDDGCRSIGLLNNMLGQMHGQKGQNVKR